RVSIMLRGRQVAVGVWRYDVKGYGDYSVPVFFLDTDVPENAEEDRSLTHWLYGGDPEYRLCQEAILGMAGIRMLRTLGYGAIERFHMNEGHASLLTLELLDEYRAGREDRRITTEAIDAVRRQCIFTTHTPVPAGHDKFPKDLVREVLGEHEAFELENEVCCDGTLNMTYLALNLSHYVNGVAKRHGEVSRLMFRPYRIDSITNGVHAATWVCEAFHELFDAHIPGWREDNFSLRYALSISPDKVWEAHMRAKRELIDTVNRQDNVGMDHDVLTIGFARRATSYKRPDLIFHDVDRLRAIGSHRPLQLVFSGKAHPRDETGKALIQKVIQTGRQLGPDVKVSYLPNYDIVLGKLLTAGVDVWLNTPQPPMEASGTSGMKAALNGVPSLSVLDGWWIEGCIEGVTGWAIGPAQRSEQEANDREQDAASLYEKLESAVAPMFYDDRKAFMCMMGHAIALNGSFFNTQRMMQQYVLKGYFH
ncbi:MAG TPA: alpha-glucan family phosphorylase, partial [Phycisphaerales bacterium]|nr:alpha-glucan family phosphorylase [Phycisphaerales bacterium]